ncbi:MAG: DNA alkylation repair protein [Candidatus Azobacteroides sp.]|nr:DNA alkylation repair protein [Candidatus Azobacteroides sp.]
MNKRINHQLHTLAETNYKKFKEKLIPTKYEILGIRMPALKKLAKELAKDPDVDFYLKNAEYTTYEHIMLYGLVLGQIKNLSPETFFRYLDPLILRFDNWAHVDCIITFPSLFKKYPDEMLSHFLPLKTHGGEFTKRTFVLFLMAHCMDEAHIDTTLKHLSEVPQGQYYTDMSIAWALSVGLIKFYDKTISYLEQKVFTRFVHNKAIQKARESYRVSPELKEHLNTMKIK